MIKHEEAFVKILWVTCLREDFSQRLAGAKTSDGAQAEEQYSPRMSEDVGVANYINHSFGAERVWRSRRRENLSIVMKKNLYK